MADASRLSRINFLAIAADPLAATRLEIEQIIAYARRADDALKELERLSMGTLETETELVNMRRIARAARLHDGKETP